MKNILVWLTSPMLERQGGPSTYLYNLSRLLNSNNFNIEYLPDIIDFSNEPVLCDNSFRKKRNQLVPTFLKNIYNKVMLSKKIVQNYKHKIKIDIDLAQYFAIHFHSTIDLIQASNMLLGYRGKIILTTHTPCPPYYHDLNHMKISPQKLNKKLLKKIALADLQAFQKADILLFPCEEAISSYYEGYDFVLNFKTLLSTKEIYFLPTGAPISRYVKSREEIRKAYSIPDDSFILHYAGRHNEEKGYDFLIDFGKLILETYPNVYFLITGKTGNLPPLKHKRWIEVGWTNDPFSFANASDLFILPNRIAYFDLVLLEMLSLGLPVILSDVGGNAYFKKYADKMEIGFIKLNKINEAKEIVENFIKLKSNRSKNNEIYSKYFTLERFAQEYREFYSLTYKKYAEF